MRFPRFNGFLGFFNGFLAILADFRRFPPDFKGKGGGRTKRTKIALRSHEGNVKANLQKHLKHHETTAQDSPKNTEHLSKIIENSVNNCQTKWSFFRFYRILTVKN